MTTLQHIHKSALFLDGNLANSFATLL